jgi:hypothetical protein
MSPDFSELLPTFNAQNVEYLIVGAHALAVYGHVQATKDLDVWISRQDLIRNKKRPLDYRISRMLKS